MHKNKLYFVKTWLWGYSGEGVLLN